MAGEGVLNSNLLRLQVGTPGRLKRVAGARVTQRVVPILVGRCGYRWSKVMSGKARVSIFPYTLNNARSSKLHLKPSTTVVLISQVQLRLVKHQK